MRMEQPLSLPGPKGRGVLGTWQPCGRLLEAWFRGLGGREQRTVTLE